MFPTLEDDFYPEELTVRQQILKHNDLLDRSIRSWKTRRKLRIRTQRRVEKRILDRENKRLIIWTQKQQKLFYRFKGWLRDVVAYLQCHLVFILLKELVTVYRQSKLSVYVNKPCYLRRLKTKNRTSAVLFT
uniref:Uncharacterized protein n=1 Tax=Tsukubamonas globosa TaxID=875863 RepID=W8VY34_9EUKA|nr:hypothetical protein [Tsukubamonas globosa]BAO51967.1 hypothetical protein [Tsukubamonas globosa]